jgi:hypothetical protein
LTDESHLIFEPLNAADADPYEIVITDIAVVIGISRCVDDRNILKTNQLSAYRGALYVSAEQTPLSLLYSNPDQTRVFLSDLLRAEESYVGSGAIRTCNTRNTVGTELRGIDIERSLRQYTKNIVLRPSRDIGRLSQFEPFLIRQPFLASFASQSPVFIKLFIDLALTFSPVFRDLEAERQGKISVFDILLNLRYQLVQFQPAENVAFGFSKTQGQLFDVIAEFFLKQLVTVRLVDRIDVLSLQVFSRLDLEDLIVCEISDDHVDRIEPAFFAGQVPPLAADDLIRL